MMLMIEHLMHFLFVLSISYYFMSAMQWYSYRLERVVFHFHRYDWHGYFFVHRAKEIEKLLLESGF